MDSPTAEASSTAKEVRRGKSTRTARLPTSCSSQPARADFYRFSPDGTRLRFNEYFDQATYRIVGKPRRRQRPASGGLARGSWRRLLRRVGTRRSQLLLHFGPGLPGRETCTGSGRSPSLGGYGGGRLTQLTAGPVDFGPPLVAEDGASLFAIGEQARAEIVRLEPGVAEPVPALPGISADSLVYSPDGNWMAWTQLPDATLWRSRRDGSNRLQLTTAGRPSRTCGGRPTGRSLRSLRKCQCPQGLESSCFPPLAVNRVKCSTKRPRRPRGRRTAGRSRSEACWSTAQPIRTVDLDSRVVIVVPGSDGLALPLSSPDRRSLRRAHALVGSRGVVRREGPAVVAYCPSWPSHGPSLDAGQPRSGSPVAAKSRHLRGAHRWSRPGTHCQREGHSKPTAPTA